MCEAHHIYEGDDKEYFRKLQFFHVHIINIVGTLFDILIIHALGIYK